MNKKNALIDQFMLILLIFFVLIALGGTIADNMQARNKYYNLKKITDNSVLTLAKYYNTFNRNATQAEDVNNTMLQETKLGKEIASSIVYEWDFVSTPNTVRATISNYAENTFWLKFLGLETLNINVTSVATVTDQDSTDPTTTISYGFAPFAINDRNFSIGDNITMQYALTADWNYGKKDTFYPVFSDCPCDCDFALSNKFDFSDLGFDMTNCNSSSAGCDITIDGNNEFVDYAKTIPDVYNSEPFVNFDDGQISAPVCLAGTYLGNTTSTWGTQINALSKYMQDIVGTDGANLPIEMDLLTLNNGAIANGVVRVKVTGFTYKKTGNVSGQFIELVTEVIPAIDKKVELEF